MIKNIKKILFAVLMLTAAVAPMQVNAAGGPVKLLLNSISGVLAISSLFSGKLALNLLKSSQTVTPSGLNGATVTFDKTKNHIESRIGLTPARKLSGGLIIGGGAIGVFTCWMATQAVKLFRLASAQK